MNASLTIPSEFFVPLCDLETMPTEFLAQGRLLHEMDIALYD